MSTGRNERVEMSDERIDEDKHGETLGWTPTQGEKGE